MPIQIVRRPPLELLESIRRNGNVSGSDCNLHRGVVSSDRNLDQDIYDSRMRSSGTASHQRTSIHYWPQIKRFSFLMFASRSTC